jgi:hypothetical protein
MPVVDRAIMTTSAISAESSTTTTEMGDGAAFDGLEKGGMFIGIRNRFVQFFMHKTDLILQCR